MDHIWAVVIMEHFLILIKYIYIYIYIYIYMYMYIYLYIYVYVYIYIYIYIYTHTHTYIHAQVDRIWAVVIMEHFLILIKIIIVSIIPTEPREAILVYETQQERKQQQLEKWDIILEEA